MVRPLCRLWAFAPVDTPKIAIAVYVEMVALVQTMVCQLGSLMIEQYINGKLTPGDEARAAAVQKRHIAYSLSVLCHVLTLFVSTLLSV